MQKKMLGTLLQRAEGRGQRRVRGQEGRSAATMGGKPVSVPFILSLPGEVAAEGESTRFHLASTTPPKSTLLKLYFCVIKHLALPKDRSGICSQLLEDNL